MNREVVMTALFDLLTGPPMVFGFTADTTTGDEVLANVSDTTGLMLGMPISGPGIAEHSLIVDLSPLTLSQAATGDNTAAPLTQGFQTASRRRAQQPARCAANRHRSAGQCALGAAPGSRTEGGALLPDRGRGAEGSGA
jgi:hypothetical protein